MTKRPQVHDPNGTGFIAGVFILAFIIVNVLAATGVI